MNCTYKLKLDREYTFNSEEALNDVLSTIDINRITANPQGFKIENGKIVENVQLTPEQRQNIQDLKQLEPAYAQVSDEKVQEFIESIYPNTTINTILWHGSEFKFNKFKEGDSLNGIHFGNLTQAKSFTTYAENELFLEPNEYGFYSVVLNVNKIKRVKDVDKSYKEIFDIEDSKKQERVSEWKAVIDAAKKEGHDGLVYENEVEGKGDSFVVFNPNQITILNSPETIQKFQEFIGKEQRIQSGTKTLSNYKSILDKLSKKFNIRYQLVNNPNVGWKGKFENGVVFINEANFTDDTLFHEFAHPFIDAVRLKNKKLYESLKNEILTNDLGLSKLNQVKELYPELSEDEQIEETIVQLLGEYSAQIMNDMVESNSLFGYLRKVWNWISNELKNYIGRNVKVEELSPTMTLEELSYLMTLSDKRLDLWSGNRVKAESITNDFLNKGFVITGSLALSKQGVVIRPTDEVHDLDFFVKIPTENSLYTKPIEKDDFRQELISMNSMSRLTVEDLKEMQWFKDLLVQYPELKEYKILDHRETYSNSYNPETDEVISLTNLINVSAGVAARGVRTNIQGIPVDFFVTYQDVNNINGYKLADDILEIKREWARPKDLQDVANYKPYSTKYSKLTEQKEVVNKLNNIKVEKKDNTYIVNGKTQGVIGVNNFIDSELERLKDADLGLVFSLENYRGALIQQELNKINAEIPDLNARKKALEEKTKEIDEKIAGFEKRTQLGSNIHLINEDVFNSEYVEDFKNLLDSLVNKHKDQFSNEYEAKKYISEIFNIKAKLYKQSKDKYGVAPVFVTEKKISAKSIDGKDIAGTIDLMIINGNGSIDIYDWKTSKSGIADWDVNKKKHVHFQLKMYEAMLNSLGFRVNDTSIIQLELANTDMKIDKIEVSEPVLSKTTVDNGVRIENQIATYYKTEKKERISKPVTNQINNFLKRAFNYEKKVVDTTVTNEELDKFKTKMKDVDNKKTYFDQVKNKTVEYIDDNQVKLYLEELRRYNSNIRSRMIDFYKTYKDKGDAVYKVNNFNNEDKTLELKTLFDKYKDWELMEDDDVMVELDVFGFRNPRTNQVVFITVNPEREEQLELNFSKGYRVDIRENTIVANYSNKVTDSRLLKATTGNLQAIKAGLFTLLADKVDGEIEQVIVVSEKNSPQVNDLNTLQTNIKQIMSYDDFGFELKQREFKTNKVNALLDFYQQYTKQDSKGKQYSKTLDEIKKGKNNLEVLVKRQQDILNQFKDDKDGLNKLKNDTEFIMLNEAIAFLNNFVLEVEEDISKWGYYVISVNRSSAETDAPNNIVNKLVAKVKELIDKAITFIRYDYEEKFFPEYAKIHKKLIDNSQSTLRQYAIGDTDEVYQNIIEKDSMRIKPLSELQGVEREYAEYFMKQIDDVRKETMGVNYSKLTEEQKREIPLIKAYTNQAKGDWRTRIKDEWSDIFNVDNVLSSDNSKREKRADVANRFAYQESHREDVLLSGDKFETNLAYVLNTYMLANMKRKRFNEVLPFINALKGIAFTANNNIFKDMSNVYSVIDSMIDTVIFNRTNFSKEDEVAAKGTSIVRNAVQDFAIGLSPATSFVQGMIGIFGNTAFAASGKLFSVKSYGLAVAKVGSNNIKEIEFRDRLNSLYGIVSKDVDLLPKQNSFITTGLRAFGSRWLHWLNYMPDFFNRTSFVVAKMIEDGSYEAHSVIDGQLIYDETKDKRWFTNGKYDANNELLLMTKRLMKEEDGLDKNGKLKRAYTFKEIRSIKEYVNQVHGSYSKEDKIKFANSVFGIIFMQFKTWMRSKLDQWWKTYRVSDVVGNYQLLKDENGNTLRDENGMPLSIWVGTPEEGFLNTLMFMIVEGKYDPRKLEGWRKNNLKQGFADLSIIMILALLSKIIDDDDKEKTTAEYLVYKLGKDAFILNTVGSLYNANMPIASISYTSNMFASILNIPEKGLEPLIQQVGLARTAYNLVNAD